MAAKSGRPGRTLIWFFAGLAITYGLVALAGTWTPALGLDLRGGTRIQLIAQDTSDGQPPTPESLEEARKIIDQRVNGSGVAEAEVLVEGSNVIVVEIPGESRADLEETVKRTAQLRFRLVACIDDGSICGTGALASPVVLGPSSFDWLRMSSGRAGLGAMRQIRPPSAASPPWWARRGRRWRLRGSAAGFRG